MSEPELTLSEEQAALKAHIQATALQLLEALNQFEHFWNKSENGYVVSEAVGGWEPVWNGFPVREFLEHFISEQV